MFIHHRQMNSIGRKSKASDKVSEPHGLCMSLRIPLGRMYDYRRMLPHHRKAKRAIFVTFCKGNRQPFPPEARDVILRHCLHDDGRKYLVHAAVVMPDHVHLLLTPLQDEDGWVYGLPAILKAIKGTQPAASTSYSVPLAQSGRKSLSITSFARKKVSKNDWNTFARTLFAEGWFRSQKTTPGSGSRNIRRKPQVIGSAQPVSVGFVWVGHSCPTRIRHLYRPICRYKRNARQLEAQIGSVALAVLRMVQDGMDVMEDVPFGDGRVAVMRSELFKRPVGDVSYVGRTLLSDAFDFGVQAARLPNYS
jgi:REP element-mobilizing transposase RayT